MRLVLYGWLMWIAFGLCNCDCFDGHLTFYRTFHAAGKHIISKRYGGNLFPGINRSFTKTDISGSNKRSLSFRSFVDMVKKSKSRVRVSEEHNDEGGGEHKEEQKSNLYEILGVERTASQQEVKKAYYKLALRLHPDKNPGDAEAKDKFQQLQKVISILGDEEKRALYDQTGCVDDADLAGEAFENLYEYFKALYKKVTEADIEEFEANYRGSDSEKNELKDLYRQCKGNMDRLFSYMLCSNPKLDSHRFMDIINEAVAGGELKETKAYRQWAKRVSETEPPKNPLKRKAKTRKQSDADLCAIISQRQNQRKEKFDSMFTSIIAKCEGKQAEKSGSEPTEEEFDAARRRLESQKQNKRRKK